MKNGLKTMDILTQFQNQFQLGPSLDVEKNWTIESVEGHVIRCQTHHGKVCFYSEIGPLSNANDKPLLIKELLQNLTCHLGQAQESITVNPNTETIELIRNLGKPESLFHMEQALEEFMNSLQFFKPIYERHIHVVEE